MNNRIQKRHTYAPHNRGAALLVLVILFTAGSILITASMGRAVYSDTVAYTRLQDTKQNILTADSSMEDVLYRLRTQKSVSNLEELALLSATTTTATLVVGDTTEVTTTATTTNRVRKRKMVLIEGGTSVAFHYGVQVGAGGLNMSGGSSIEGNVYSNGSIVGPGGSVFGLIVGDAVSAGPTGLIKKIETTGSAYAHTIEDSIIGEIAYTYPDYSDRPLGTFPITDEMIAEFENDAVTRGGTMSCGESGVYTIQNQKTDPPVSLGPIKIDCNLEIIGSSVVLLQGPVWVAGSVTIGNSAEVNLGASLGPSSGVIIADDPDNRLTSSTVNLSQSSKFTGSTAPDAYIFLISHNNSAESGGSAEAIVLDNNNAAGDVVLYASHGHITVANNSELVEVTGYKISTANSAKIIYKQGLANTLFRTGPSNGYEIDTWDDIP